LVGVRGRGRLTPWKVIEQANRTSDCDGPQTRPLAAPFIPNQEFFPHNAVEYLSLTTIIPDPKTRSRCRPLHRKGSTINDGTGHSAALRHPSHCLRARLPDVESVSCIYGRDPRSGLRGMRFFWRTGQKIKREDITPSVEILLRAQTMATSARHLPRSRRRYRDFSTYDDMAIPH